MTASDHRHHVVVVGGGFAGLQAVRGLRRARVDITLVDRRNFHLFQPLLYQVATGAIPPRHWPSRHDERTPGMRLSYRRLALLGAASAAFLGGRATRDAMQQMHAGRLPL